MKRVRLPSSRGSLKFRISLADTVWAFFAPLLALYFRDALYSYQTVILYTLLSGTFSLIAFLAFRVHDGLPRYFSAHDALDVVKAVVSGLLLTYVVLFTFTRLEGIPRPTPLIHGLILIAGLLAARVIARAFDGTSKNPQAQNSVADENIIMIGATQLTSLYVKLLNASWPNRYRFLAILDDRPQSTGRTMAGINILGSTQNLESVIDEFIVHGVSTDRVVVGGRADTLVDGGMEEIRRLCTEKAIKFDFVPNLVGLSEMQHVSAESTSDAKERAVPNFKLPRYFEVKPLIDFFAALSMILFFPIFVFATIFVLLDVGRPVLFWQQRIGQGGRKFLLYKYRTLRPPFDAKGQPVPEEKRLSALGKLMRQTRLDELPQILNVLVGDMALIGPRPLLPEDQPDNPTTRLLVRPGITGWAQVNGGKFLSPQEKDEFDEYYVRNASVWFDLTIAWMTLKVLFRRSANSDHDVSAASLVGFRKTEVWKPAEEKLSCVANQNALPSRQTAQK